MSFWELLALAGTMATILGVFLTIYALINNKTLKEEARLTRESIEESRRGIRESREETRRLLEKMDNTLRYIADLIVSEGEKDQGPHKNLMAYKIRWSPGAVSNLTIPLALLWFLAIQVANLYAGDSTRITAHELKAMMEGGESITLIDVRTPEEYRGGYIPGAVNIPLDELPTLKGFPYQGKVVLYCTAGIRSMKAKRILEKKGIKGILDLEGGIEAWKKVGGKVVIPSNPSSWHKDDDPPILSGYPKSYQVPKGVCEQGLNPSLVISK